MRLHATRRAAIAQGRGLGNPLWDLAGVPASLDLRFAESKSLIDAVSGQQLITFSRASDGAVVNSAGQIEIVAANVPRFTHDPVTLESLGLLVEEQRANLALRSEELDNASWIKINGSVTANATVAPNGTITADKFIENTANGAHIAANETASVTSGVSYTLSVFVKAAERTWVALFGSGTPFGTNAFYVNLTTGAIGSSVGTPSNIAVQRFPNGWFRISCSITAASTGAAGLQVRPATGDGGQVYQGDGSSGLFAWGAQLEVGGFPTSYIPTTGTAATRTADVVSITGANFSSWYRQNEGTVFAESSSFSNLSGSRVVSAIDDGSMSNRFQITFASGYTPNFAAVSTGTVSADLYASAPAQGFNTRFCTTYGVNDFVLSSNGGNSVTDTSGALPISVSTARLGVFQNNTGYLNGTIRRLTYWPQRLPNSTLQNITL
jgi:hypothetical protein